MAIVLISFSFCLQKDFFNAKEALNDEKVDAVISYKDGEYHVDYANTDASKTSVTRQVLRTSIASEGTNQDWNHFSKKAGVLVTKFISLLNFRRFCL